MYHFDEAINKSDRKPRLEKYNQSDLIYDTNHSFYKYHDIKKFDNLSSRSKWSFLFFFNDLNKSNKLKIQKEQAKEKKTNLYDTISELCNNLLETSCDEYHNLWNAKRSKIDPKYDIANKALDEIWLFWMV